MSYLLSFVLAALVVAHDAQHTLEHSHGHVEPLWVNTKEQTWLDKYGPQVDNAFSGALSFCTSPR